MHTNSQRSRENCGFLIEFVITSQPASVFVPPNSIQYCILSAEKPSFRRDKINILTGAEIRFYTCITNPLIEKVSAFCAENCRALERPMKSRATYITWVAPSHRICRRRVQRSDNAVSMKGVGRTTELMLRLHRSRYAVEPADPLLYATLNGTAKL